MRKLQPTWYHQKICDIPLQKLKDMGFVDIFCDLDNTLTAAYNPLPSEESYAFVSKCKALGFRLFIISNNHEDRVKKVADALQVEYFGSTGKPLRNRLKAFIKAKNVDIEKSILIGDQLLTDICFANRLGFKSILVEPFSPRDLPITRPLRFIDKIIRKKLKKRGRLKGVE